MKGLRNSLARNTKQYFKSRKENASHTLLDSCVSSTMKEYKAQVGPTQNHTHKLRNTQKSSLCRNQR